MSAEPQANEEIEVGIAPAIPVASAEAADRRRVSFLQDSARDAAQDSAQPKRSDSPEDIEEGDEDETGEDATDEVAQDRPSAPSFGQRGALFKSSRSLLRSERRLNTDTGAFATRECRVEVITGLTEPMDPAERRRREFFLRGGSSKFLGGMFKSSNNENESQEQDVEVEEVQQFRLATKAAGRDGESTLLAGIDFYQSRWSTMLLNNYVHWSWKSSFWAVLLSISVIFLLLVTLWAILIYFAAQYRPQCLYVGSLHFDEAGNFFIDAFAISWTTFSTVGYGLTGPNTSQEGTVDHCIGMNAIASVEAFFGVLFAGFAGAIIFGKIARVQSIARVEWSSPMLVRYGRGVNVEAPKPDKVVIIPTDASGDGTQEPAVQIQKRDDDSSSSDDDETKEAKLPCPVIEFRVINQLFDQVGGELINSNITVWASTLAETAAPSVRAAANGKSRNKHNFMERMNPLTNIKKGTAVTTTATKKVLKAAKRISMFSTTPKKTDNEASVRSDTSDSIIVGDNPKGIQAAIDEAVAADRRAMMTRAKSMMMSKKHVVMQEDPSNKITPQLIYSKLDIVTDSHPFFKRVWIVRHILNEESPLLSDEAQQAIHNNNGHWPREWNNYADVRRHISFNEIMVSLSGTANVSGSTAYSQKVYDYVDMNVGYRFAETLVRCPKSSNLSVDISLINDVLEQHGGGGEPFCNLTDEGDREEVEKSFGKPPTSIYARRTSSGGSGSSDHDIENQMKQE